MRLLDRTLSHFQEKSVCIKEINCDALRRLVPFVQLKKCEKQP